MRTYQKRASRPCNTPTGGCAGYGVWVTTRGIQIRMHGEPDAMTIDEAKFMIECLQRGIMTRRADMSRRARRSRTSRP